MKKLGAFLLASALLAACGSGESESTTTEAGDVLKGRSSMPPVNPAGANLLPTGVIAAPAKPPVPRPGKVTPTDRFVMFAFGDSYGSGEGNPFTLGDYNNNKNEVWAGSPGPGISPTGDARCHRSDASGSAKAAASVKANNPTVEVVHKSFACSGAESRHILSEGYEGTDEPLFRGQPLLPAQIEQALKSGIAASEVDAIYVSIGGNDAGFGKVVEQCFIWHQSSCQDADREEVQAALSDLGSVAANITNVAQKLRASFPNAHIFFSGYPDPLSVSPNDPGDKNSDGVCSNADETGPIAYANDYLWKISASDAIFIRDQFLAPLNSKISQGVTAVGSSKVWYVDGHYINQSGLAGFCSQTNTPITRFNKEALILQGPDKDLGGGVIDISKGGWHPSDAGYTAYGRAIYDKMISSGVLNTLSSPPAAPSNPWPTSLTSTGSILIEWDDNSANETSYELIYASASSPTPKTQTLPANTSKFSFNIGSASLVSVAIRACKNGTAGQAAACSNWASSSISNELPSDKPGAVSCTSSKYGQFVDSACNVTFSVPAKPTQTSSMFSYVEIKKGTTVVGAAVMPPGSGQVKLKYQGEKEGSTAQFTATAYICTIVDGGKCVAGPSSKISLVVEKPDSRKLLPAPVIPVRPNVNLPKLPGVPAPVMTPPGLGGGLQCSAGKCGP